MEEEERVCAEGGPTCEALFGNLESGVVDGVGFASVIGLEGEGIDVEGEVSSKVGETGKLAGCSGSRELG